MEPLGIIVFAVIITTSFSQVLITSIQRLLDPAQGVEELDLSPLGLGLLIANIVIKGILWIWCTTIKGSSSVQALAQDHENDVVFNVASTIFPVVGKHHSGHTIMQRHSCRNHLFDTPTYSCLGKMVLARSSRCYSPIHLYHL